MEEEDEEGAPTQGIGGVERRGLVDIVRQEVHAPAAAIAIGGLAVNMNVVVFEFCFSCVHMYM